MSYVVTGGAGFIGSTVVDLLVEKKHQVTVIDNMETGEERYLNPAARLIRRDINDPEPLEPLLAGAQGVFHLAALPRIQPSFDDPIQHDEANVRAVIRIVQAAAKAGVPKLVYSSSSAIYGDPSTFPTPESEAIAPLSPYALQKYAGEAYAFILGEKLGVKVNALRYFNVYGPRSYNPNNKFNAYSSVVGIFHNRVRQGLRPAVTGTGDQKRDFVHVRDVAMANYLAMTKDVAGQAFNVGTGDSISINALAALFAPAWDQLPERGGEAAVTHADITKIRAMLDWNPVIRLMDAIAAGNV